MILKQTSRAVAKLLAADVAHRYSPEQSLFSNRTITLTEEQLAVMFALVYEQGFHNILARELRHR